MEKMPYQPHLEPTLPPSDQTSPTVTSDWRTGLPCLTGNLISLRELRASDAPALFSALSSEQVSRFISPPPATVDVVVEGIHRYPLRIERRSDGRVDVTIGDEG